MTVEINNPETEALIAERLQSGGFDNAEGVILAALRATSRLRGTATVNTSPEMDYLVENAHELEQYAGERLLIQGKRLVAHSRDFKDIQAAIRENQIESPFIYYVPTPEESNAAFI